MFGSEEARKIISKLPAVLPYRIRWRMFEACSDTSFTQIPIFGCDGSNRPASRSGAAARRRWDRLKDNVLRVVSCSPEGKEAVPRVVARPPEKQTGCRPLIRGRRAIQRNEVWQSSDCHGRNGPDCHQRRGDRRGARLPIYTAGRAVIGLLGAGLSVLAIMLRTEC